MGVFILQKRLYNSRAMKKEIRIVSFLVLIAVVALWGVAPVVSKAVFDRGMFSPGVLIMLRGLVSIIAMAIVINKGFKKIDKSYLICIPAGVILALAYIFQFVGLKFTAPSKNAFLENISCITIPLFMFLLIRERPKWYSIMAAALCVVGSLILVGNGFDFGTFFKSGDIKGDGLSAIGGLFFGLDTAFTKVYSKGKDPLIFVFLQLCVMTVLASAYAFIFEGAVFHTFTISFDIVSVLIVIFLGVVCTAVCWVCRAWAMKYIDAVTVSLLVPFSAVVASILSIAFELEQFTLNLMIGGLVIITAVAISAYFDYRRGLKDDAKESLELKNPPEEIEESQ